MLLYRHRNLMHGHVVDIGGKKEKKRGQFRPPASVVKCWQYVNIDRSTDPDFCCSAESIPVDEGAFDTAVLCEVLEHLERPEVALKEAFRILKWGGVLIGSTPFLFPVHGDPCDFQRWTHAKIRVVLRKIGFSDIKIEPMGGIGAVTHDLLLISVGNLKSKYLKFFGLFALWVSGFILLVLEKIFKTEEKAITTGYFVIAKKIKVKQ